LYYQRGDIEGAMIRYRAIAEDLRASFARGNVADGHPLPSEHELCAAYGVSRTTIRAALEWLEHEGLVARRQGSGTFYRSPALAKRLGSIVDFHTEALQAGRRPRTRVLGLSVRPPTPTETIVFGAGGVRAGIAELKRLRYLDGEPGVLQRSVLSGDMLGRVKARQLEDASLYAFLAKHRKIAVHSVEETLEPALAEGEDAALLAVPTGTPVFRSHRRARDASGRVIEMSDNLIRGDIYRFTVRRTVEEPS
jgi:GntR family transcriptional regulator